MNDFLKKLAWLFTELHDSEGMASVIIVDEIKMEYDKHVNELKNKDSSRIVSRLNECLEQKQKIADEVAAWWEQQSDDTVILSEEMQWLKKEAEVKAQIQLIRHLLDDS